MKITEQKKLYGNAPVWFYYVPGVAYNVGRIDKMFTFSGKFTGYRYEVIRPDGETIHGGTKYFNNAKACMKIKIQEAWNGQI